MMRISSLKNKFCKPKEVKDAYSLFFKAIFLIALFSLCIGSFVNKSFFERFFSTDGHIVDQFYLSYISFFRLVFIVLGVLFFIMFLLKNQLTKLIRFISKDWMVAMIRFNQMRAEKVPMAVLFPQPPVLVRSISLGVLLIWSIFIGYTLYFDRLLLERFTVENGITETLTVICYFLAATLVVCQIKRCNQKKMCSPMQKWWLILAVLFFVFVAIEEINWGQAYLNFKTPDMLSAINIQGQTNLHNITLLFFQDKGTSDCYSYWSNTLLFLLALNIGIIIPFLAKTIPVLARFFLAVGLPLPSAIVQLGFFFVILLPTEALMGSSFSRQGIPGELKEFTCALSFLILIWHLRYAHKQMRGDYREI